MTKNLNARSILFTCDGNLVAGLYQVVTYQAATVPNKMNYLACDRSWLWAVESGRWFQMGSDPIRPMSCYWVLLWIESGDLDRQKGRETHRITWATWLVRYRKGGCLTTISSPGFHQLKINLDYTYSVLCLIIITTHS